jgi:hypothetical protein
MDDTANCPAGEKPKQQAAAKHRFGCAERGKSIKNFNHDLLMNLFCRDALM